MKKYVIIGGVNGAGKLTLYLTLSNSKNMPGVNVDEIVKASGDWRNPSDVMQKGE